MQIIDSQVHIWADNTPERPWAPNMVANALYNATGLRMTELPMSPPKVLAALSATKPSVRQRAETHAA